MQRNVAVLEDRAHGDGELLAARAALPNAFTISDLAGLLWLASNRREFGGFTYKPTVKAAPFGVRPAFITVAILAKEKAAETPAQ